MKKILKNTLALFLVTIMLFGVVPINSFVQFDLNGIFYAKPSAAKITSYKQGDTIEFGWYPQSRVTDPLIVSALNLIGGNWISYDYYSGTGNASDGKMDASDYMKYKDVVYDGNKYRGVYFDSYRPMYTGYTSSDAYTYQDDNGYYSGTVYWFKYDSIEWRILDPVKGMIMSEIILDSQPYNNFMLYSDSEFYGDSEKTYFANDYEKSSIREWLNKDFYENAFSEEQQSIIQYTTLDNSACYDSYSKYDSATTKDKIYLLSYEEVLNESYGFSSSFYSDDFCNSGRSTYSSDYAKCQGLDERNVWSLRSPSHHSEYSCCVYGNGGVHDYYFGNSITIRGVRPALNLDLENLQSNVPSVPSEKNIYNLGEETYSFDNFGDSDSLYGHCFGMSMTSSAYYTGELDTNIVGVSNAQYINGLSLTAVVKEPICKYQDIQGSYSLGATVAGGSYYKTRQYNINSDWNEVVNYVKSHEYDNRGALQIGYRKNNQGGHAINFLRYEEVNGQPRIYAYDNNFPDTEVYFYKDANGDIKQAPYSTFSGSIDCIALRSVTTYFNIIDSYDSTRCIVANRDTIVVDGASTYPIDGDIEMGERVVFEIPANLEQVTIVPLVEDASFTYLDEEYSFENADENTVGILRLATADDTSNTLPELTVYDKSEIAQAEIRNPSITTISYGDSIVLHADVTEALPEGWRIEWSADNGNFSYSVSNDGTTCTITPSSSGDTTFTLKVFDAQNNEISSDTQKMTSKAGFFDKIIAFFKKIFGLTKILPSVWR